MSSTRPDAGVPSTLANDVVQLLVGMSARLGQHFASCAAAYRLSPGEGKVLLALSSDEALSMRALARRLGFDASNLTGLVDKLEERTAVMRRVDPADRRVKTIVLTDQGAQLRDGLYRRLRADAGPVSALDESQLADLRALLVLAMGTDHV